MTAIFILFLMIKSQTSSKIQNLCLTLSCIVSSKNMYISYMMVSFLWYSVGCYCDFIVIWRRLMILCRSRYPYFFSNMSEKLGPITRCFAYLILTGSIQFYNALIVQNRMNNTIQYIPTWRGSFRASKAFKYISTICLIWWVPTFKPVPIRSFDKHSNELLFPPKLCVRRKHEILEKSFSSIRSRKGAFLDYVTFSWIF